MSNKVVELTFPVHASEGRGDIVAATERRFTEEIQRVLDQKSEDGLKLVSTISRGGLLRLFFTTA